MKKIRLFDIPAGVGVAVFGVAADQMTVNGDPVCTYESSSGDSVELLVDLEPKSGGVVIRFFGVEYRFRPDRERLIPGTDRYEQDLRFAWANIPDDLRVSDYLEPDSAISPREPRSRHVLLLDETSYPERPTLPGVVDGSRAFGSGSPRVRAHLYYTAPSAAAVELRHFEHSLPRVIRWLLYPPLPRGNSKSVEGVLFHYPFGEDATASPELLGRQPWRADASNQDAWLEAKARLETLIAEKGGESEELSTRELRNRSARFLVDDYPLTLPAMMAWSHPGEYLWRYLTLPKLISLVSTSTLWFARPSTFDDPFESKTNGPSRARHVARFIERIIDDFNMAARDEETEFMSEFAWVGESLAKGDDGQVIQHEFASLGEVPVRVRYLAEEMLDRSLDSTLVSSWNLNETESEALWFRYTDGESGVAIVTSFERLKSCFTSFAPDILKVDYVDLHDPDLVHQHLPASYKHTAFAHECEVRAYLRAGGLAQNIPGMAVEIDLNQLIERIVLSPRATSWVRDSVHWALDKAGVTAPVEPSLFTIPLH